MSESTQGHEQADASADAPQDLAAQLERVAQERDDAIARLQRATADYQNLRRRQQTDLENALQRGLEPLLSKILIVLDNLELALAAPAEGAEAKSLARGVALTRDALLALLKQEGVEPIAADKQFDASRHHAVAMVERVDLAPGTIVDVVRRGYTWRDKPLRPADVRVAAAPQG